jgi:hypothetical protein
MFDAKIWEADFYKREREKECVLVCTFQGCARARILNSVSYAGHILTKKGLRAALREKMSPLAAIGG